MVGFMQNLFKNMKKKYAFTLAEVLITLGIIGVVAAMTIPNLIANTNGAKFRSQFKKSLSTLNQAGRMAQAQYGFSYGDAETCGSNTKEVMASENPEAKMSFCAIFNGTLAGSTVHGTITSFSYNGKYYYNEVSHIAAVTPNSAVYSLADGSLVIFNDAGTSGGSNSKDCTLPLGTVMNSDWIESHYQCRGFIDVNGVSKPNKEVTCTSETTTTSPDKPCTVKNDANHMTDIFPIVFHDSTVEPATNAAAYVLRTAK